MFIEKKKKPYTTKNQREREKTWDKDDALTPFHVSKSLPTTDGDCVSTSWWSANSSKLSSCNSDWLNSELKTGESPQGHWNTGDLQGQGLISPEMLSASGIASASRHSQIQHTIGRVWKMKIGMVNEPWDNLHF